MYKRVQDHQARGGSFFYTPECPGRRKPSSADGPLILFRCGSCSETGNTFFRWSMVHCQSGKIKGKEPGRRKNHRMEEVSFAGGGSLAGWE